MGDALMPEMAGHIAVPARPRIYQSHAFGITRWIVLDDPNPFPRMRLWRRPR